MLFRLLRSVRTMFCVVACLFVLVSQAVAEKPAAGPTTDSANATPAPNLAASQEAIEMRYRRFEGTLQQLSEYLRKTDPARAELLVRAIGKSKEGRIPDQLQHLTDLLKKDQLGDAVERQEMVVTELQAILELLMSEARKDDLERERKRIQELIKDVNKLISKETDARAETERGGNNSELQNQQKQVADSTQKLVQRIESQDAAKKAGKDGKESESSKKSGKPNDKDANQGEKKPGDKSVPDSKDADDAQSDQKDDPKNSDGKSDSGKDGEGKDKQSTEKPSDTKKPEKSGDEKNSKSGEKSGKDEEKKPGDAESKPGDSPKPGDSQESDPKQGKSQPGKQQQSKPQSGKPQKSKPQQGKPQEGEQQDQPPENGQKQDDQQDQQDQSPDGQDNAKKPQDKTAGREELERAKLEMDLAIEELKKNNKKNASDKQDKAIAELMKAKEKLEEILRQLREEEKELVLAQMEARFRDMLLKQEAVNNATLAIHAVPVDRRTDRHRNRAVELARNEDEITLLAAKALTLLKEEGSSVAFPEAVEQIRDDMLTIARRLERVDVGEITQNIEQDTVESLKEIIEALQKELEKIKDKKQSQQQQQQQQQQGLVNKLAEMKMLRSLQYRVNRRTKQLGRMVDGEQAVDMDIVSQLKQLSDRQAKVQKATYDLATGKSQ